MLHKIHRGRLLPVPVTTVFNSACDWRPHECRRGTLKRASGFALAAALAFGVPLLAQEQGLKIAIDEPGANTIQNAPKLSVPFSFRVTTQASVARILVKVAGQATETGFEVCGARVPCQGQPPDYKFSLRAPVFPGENRITVTIVDKEGATAEASVRFSVVRPAAVAAPVEAPSPAPLTLAPRVTAAAAVCCRLLVLTPRGPWNSSTQNYEFVKALQPLLNHKNATGMTAKLMTIEDIYETPDYRGRDHAEIIKKAIFDAWKNLHIEYVMLVGDVDWFPVRYTRIYDLGHWGHSFTPSDLYYADVADATGAFSSWDYDGDMLFGESQKNFAKSALDFNRDRMHLIPEVAVGRVPISDVNELRRYVQKVIDYELTAEPAWFKTALLVSGDYPGSEGTNDVIAGKLTSAGFTVTKRYDSSTPATGRVALLKSDFNQGAGFVSYVGHGNGTTGTQKNGGEWSGWINYMDIVPLENQAKLPVITAAACSTAQFHFGLTFLTSDGFQRTEPAWPDNQYKYNDMPLPEAVQPASLDKDGFAEQFLLKRSNGAIAYIGAYTGTQGPAHDMSIDFYDSYASGKKILGDAWNGALQKFIATYYTALSYPTDSWYQFDSYHHMHKMMLFGDPSLRLGGLPACPAYCPKETCLNLCDEQLQGCLQGGGLQSACQTAAKRCIARCDVCDTCRQ